MSIIDLAVLTTVLSFGGATLAFCLFWAFQAFALTNHREETKPHVEKHVWSPKSLRKLS